MLYLKKLQGVNTQHVGLITGHNGWVTKICLSPENPDIIFSASRDKTILMRKVLLNKIETTSSLIQSFNGHNHIVQDITVSSDGMHVLSGSWDQTVRLWDINKNNKGLVMNGHTNDVMSVSMLYHDRLLVSGSRDHVIKIWNTEGRRRYQFQGNREKSCISALQIHVDDVSMKLFSADYDGMVKIWDLRRFRFIKAFQLHQNAIYSLSISHNGEVLVTGGKDKRIVIWDQKNEKVIRQISVTGEVAAVSINPFFPVFAAAVEEDVNIYLIHEDFSTKLSRIDNTQIKNPPRAKCVCWSSDGDYLYVGYTDNVIRVFYIHWSG